MRPLSALLTSLLLLTAAAPAEAAPWRWNLEPKQSYGFEYRSTSDLTMTLPMGLGEVRDKVAVDTDFDLEVLRVLPDGRYDVEIPIRKLVITSKAGERTTLDDLPADVRTMRALMTPQGRFQFTQKVVVEVLEGGVYGLATLRRDGDVAKSEVTAGNDELELSAKASIDPKTGRVTVAASVKERKPAQQEEEQPAQQTDVLPADILALLELPDGDVTPGDRFDLTTPLGSLAIRAVEPRPCGEARCGVLTVKMDADSAPATRMVQDAAAADGMDMGMPGGMPGMPAELGALMGGDIGAMAATPTMRVDVDVTALFDAAAGRMHTVEGRAGSTTDAGGVKVQESTRFTLTHTGVR